MKTAEVGGPRSLPMRIGVNEEIRAADLAGEAIPENPGLLDHLLANRRIVNQPHRARRQFHGLLQVFHHLLHHHGVKWIIHEKDALIRLDPIMRGVRHHNVDPGRQAEPSPENLHVSSCALAHHIA